MDSNFSLVTHSMKTRPITSIKLGHSFLTKAMMEMFPKNFENFDHMRNLCLVYMKLTPLCNLRCVMCGQRGDKGILKGPVGVEEAKKIPPFEVYKKFVDDVAPTRPTFYLWGGEPFMYPHLFELIRHIRSRGMLATVNTNGTFLEKYAEQIVRDQWDGLFVSLDGFEEVNDAIRGKGSYQNVVRGFEALNREKERQKSDLPFLSVVTTVTNKNYEYLADLATAMKDFKLAWHIFNLGTYTNDNIVAAQKKLMKERFDTDIDCLEAYNTGYNTGIDGKKLHSILDALHGRDFGHPMVTVPTLNPEKTHEYYAELETPVRNHCPVPWCQCNVNYDGSVHFCADYPDYVLGNLKEQSISEIYNGERANKFRRELHNAPDGMFPGCLRCYQNMLFGKKVKGF